MFIEDIMNDFDNISADFFDSKVSEEETLNALENLLAECQNSFDEYSEKYKNNVKQLEQLMIEISNFELAICSNILDNEEEEEDPNWEESDTYEADYMEATKELSKLGYVTNHNEDDSVNFADEEETTEEIVLEETTVPENTKVEDWEWAINRLDDIQNTKSELHGSSITIKKAIEDRLTQYQEVLNTGDKAKILFESQWIKRDLPIYKLEIKKWGLQFQEYVNELQSQQEAISEFVNNEIENADVQDYQNPVDIASLSSEKNAEKNAQDQEEVTNLDNKINELENQIQEDIENLKNQLEEAKQQTEQNTTEEVEETETSETTSEGENMESTMESIVDNLNS
jgi:hypothetical protein